MNTEALHKYLSAVESKQVTLGHHDCVRFVVEALYVGFDRDYRAQLEYWDRRSAVVRLRRAGGLRNAASDAFGHEVPKKKLVPGDVAYLEIPQATLGLILPGYIAMKVGHTIHRVDFRAIDFGWKT